MASASADNIKQWKFPDGNFIQNLTGHNAILNCLAINSDNVLVSGGKSSLSWLAVCLQYYIRRVFSLLLIIFCFCEAFSVTNFLIEACDSQFYKEIFLLSTCLLSKRLIFVGGGGESQSAHSCSRVGKFSANLVNQRLSRHIFL